MSDGPAGDVAGRRRQRARRTSQARTREQDAGARQRSGNGRVERRGAVVAAGVEAVDVDVVVGVVRRPRQLREHQGAAPRRIADTQRADAPDRGRHEEAGGGIEDAAPRAADEADPGVHTVPCPRPSRGVFEFAPADVDGVEGARRRTPVDLRERADQTGPVALQVTDGETRRPDRAAQERRVAVDLIPAVQPGDPQVDGAAGTQAVPGHADRVDEVVDEQAGLELDGLAARTGRRPGRAGRRDPGRETARRNRPRRTGGSPCPSRGSAAG